MMMIQTHIFTVTRQIRWIDGLSVVEVSQGGIEYVNPDALVQKYPGEFEEYVGMKAAIKAAIEVARLWKKDLGRKKHIYIGVGCTHGMSVPFDVKPANKKVFRRLLKEAKTFDEKLPKCVRCGDFLTGKNHRNDFNEYPFCSENCAENDYYERIKELNE
jgi:endogenous inhibitor of DNA gyrase (YacG/DUF329 family)